MADTDTYSILLSDFHAPVTLACGARVEARFDIELVVDHPGPGFPDDISAVMSYEPIVRALRRLCAEQTAAQASRLADAAARLCVASSWVHTARVRVDLPSDRPGQPSIGAETTLYSR